MYSINFLSVTFFLNHQCMQMIPLNVCCKRCRYPSTLNKCAVTLLRRVMICPTVLQLPPCWSDLHNIASGNNLWKLYFCCLSVTIGKRNGAHTLQVMMGLSFGMGFLWTCTTRTPLTSLNLLLSSTQLTK